MSKYTLTTDGNTVVNGIAPGQEFAISATGTFAGATLNAQYCTALPAAATLAVADADETPACTLTAVNAGVSGNAYTLAITASDVANAPLSIAQTGPAFVVTPANNSGDAATVTIGTGTDGVVTATLGGANAHVQATQILTMATKPTANDTVTIGGIVYKFVATPTLNGHVAIGDDAAASQANLVSAINTLSAFHHPNPFVTASDFAANAMTVTARAIGYAGNGIACTETLTNAGNVWTAAVTAGGVTAYGVGGNECDIQAVAGVGNNVALSAAWAYGYARDRIVVTLGTGGAGALDNAKNTAVLIAAVIDALPFVSATKSGTGATAITAAVAVKAFTGGGANPDIVSTSADLVNLINASAICAPHFAAALKAEYAGDGLLEALVAAAFTGGTIGTFADYLGDNALSFSVAGQAIGTNCGIARQINLALSGDEATTSITAIVTPIK